MREGRRGDRSRDEGGQVFLRWLARGEPEAGGQGAHPVGPEGPPGVPVDSARRPGRRRRPADASGGRSRPAVTARWCDCRRARRARCSRRAGARAHGTRTRSPSAWSRRPPVRTGQRDGLIEELVESSVDLRSARVGDTATSLRAFTRAAGARAARLASAPTFPRPRPRRFPSRRAGRRRPPPPRRHRGAAAAARPRAQPVSAGDTRGRVHGIAEVTQTSRLTVRTSTSSRPARSGPDQDATGPREGQSPRRGIHHAAILTVVEDGNDSQLPLAWFP